MCLYPALEIVSLKPMGDEGEVTTGVTVHNQNNDLVLSGQPSFLLRTA